MIVLDGVAFHYISVPRKQTLLEFALAWEANKGKYVRAGYRKTQRMSNLETALTGLFGEESLAAILRSRARYELYVASDGGWDLILPSGLRIAIRFNHWRDGRLFVKQMPEDDPPRHVHKLRGSHVVVSMNGPCDRDHCECKDMSVGIWVSVGGWMWTCDFYKHCTWYNARKGDGPKWTVDTRLLRPLTCRADLPHPSECPDGGACISTENLEGRKGALDFMRHVAKPNTIPTR